MSGGSRRIILHNSVSHYVALTMLPPNAEVHRCHPRASGSFPLVCHQGDTTSTSTPQPQGLEDLVTAECKGGEGWKPQNYKALCENILGKSQTVASAY
ncbi:hypothetical protein BS78_01G425200 [Paspalum vaginatum]|nr:hypothetical protein BS78_01G425200 [Paspalum vaginatum]